jgi:hypothetical protein
MVVVRPSSLCQESAICGWTWKFARVVMHSDLKSLDPVWSGAYIVRNHGYLIYDTLFALDVPWLPS